MIDTRLRHAFDEPDRRFGPTPLWWWSGEEVTRERLLWQLEKLNDGGIHNLVIINLASAGPTYGAMADDPAWFSETWWDRLRDTCAYMAEHDMKLWFYDQIGFSGANLQGRITRDNPWARGQRLIAEKLPVNQAQWPEPPTGKTLGTWPAGNGEVLRVTAVPTALDYLSREAFDLLLDTVHREFERRVPEYLGTVIVGSFQDELPNTNGWTTDFPEQFQHDHGYDLMEHLGSLFLTGEAHHEKVRSDYYATRTRLTEDAVFKPMFTWHAKYELLQGADQTNPARTAYPIQSTQMYTDYPRTHRWINAVGSDHQGDAKFHSSLAHLYDHPAVWIEAFHSSGWGGTLEETWDWLVPFLRSGATIYNPHASYFSTVAGWFEWAPPSTDWRQPYWAQYPAFAKAVARTASIMSWGTHQARVCVLHPTTVAQAEIPLDTPIAYFADHPGARSVPESMEATEASQRDYLALCGSTNWWNPIEGRLDAASISFDIIDDESIQRATTTDAQLVISGLAFDTVVLPGCRTLEEATARALIRFMDAGGRVICVGDAPIRAAGCAGDDSAAAAVTAHDRCLVVETPDDAVATIGAGRDLASSDVPLLVRRDGDTVAALVVGAHHRATHYGDEVPGMGRRRLHFDRSRYAEHRQVRVNGEVSTAECWNPSTGKANPVRVTREAGHSTIDVAMGGAPAMLVVWTMGSPVEGATVAPQEAGAQRRRDISTGWSGSLVPTLDNTWGDLARPIGASLDRVQVWDVTDSNGQPGRAGFGEQALVLPATVEPEPPLSAATCAAVANGSANLGGPTWKTVTWSRSRGQLRAGRERLGNKGFVARDFITVDAPAPDTEVAIRTLMTTDHRGPAHLVVSTDLPVRIWWNGVEQPGRDDRRSRSVPVTVERATNVLEYRIQGDGTTGRVRSHFTLMPEPVLVPEFIASAHLSPRDGRLTFSKEFDVPADLTRAKIVIGTASAAVVSIDDHVVAHQARVEYYEGNHDPQPQYFSHDITSLLTPSGHHRLIVAVETDDPGACVLVDAVLATPAGQTVFCTDESWLVEVEGESGRSSTTRCRTHDLEHVFVARRPHPLPEGNWLTGPPEVGRAALDIWCSTTTAPTTEVIEFTAPAGTTRIDVAARAPIVATIDGARLGSDGSTLDLPSPTQEATSVRLEFEEVTTPRGPSLLAGPVLLDVTSAPMSLRPWNEAGLGSWSGGVRYTRNVDPTPGHPWQLDLGDLRGSVEVWLDDELVAQAFCGPFRFDMPPITAPASLSIVVRNTLAPFLGASTPTVYAYEEQLPSGLYGPLTLVDADPDATQPPTTSTDSTHPTKE